MEEWRGLPFAPERGTVLCRLGDLPEHGGKEVVPKATRSLLCKA
jgi:hypothetical protein